MTICKFEKMFLWIIVYYSVEFNFFKEIKKFYEVWQDRNAGKIEMKTMSNATYRNYQKDEWNEQNI